MLATTLDFTYFLANSDSRQRKPLVEGTYVLSKMQVQVFPEWYKEVTVTWRPNTAWVNPRFNVYRTQSGYDNMRLLTAQPLTVPQFVDSNTNMVSKYANDFYVIEVILDGRSAGYTEPTPCQTKLPQWHDLRVREINRREWILLTRFTGQKSLLLKNVKYGQYETRCPVCWDDVHKIVTSDRCSTCFGTSYRGGYYTGVPTFFQYDNFNKTKMLRADGTYEPADFTCWTIRMPAVDPDDLILRVTDKTIYRVINVLDSEMLSNTVRQMVSISQLPKTAIEYELLNREGVLP